MTPFLEAFLADLRARVEELAKDPKTPSAHVARATGMARDLYQRPSDRDVCLRMCAEMVMAAWRRDEVPSIDGNSL